MENKDEWFTIIAVCVQNLVFIVLSRKIYFQNQHDIFPHHFVRSLFVGIWVFPRCSLFHMKGWLSRFVKYKMGQRVQAADQYLYNDYKSLFDWHLKAIGTIWLTSSIWGTICVIIALLPHFLLASLATKDAEWNTQVGPLLITSFQWRNLATISL